MTSDGLRFGVQCAAAASREEWAAKARRAEVLGFTSFVVPDHFGDQLAPMVALMAAADATESIALGTFVCDNDFRHPAVLAKEAATLQLLSGGRLELGLGAGWLGKDYERTGIRFAEPKVRVDRLQETVAILKAFFAGGTVDHRGRRYRIADLPAEPRVARSPELLIGAGGQRMLSIAAREADVVGVLPRSRSDGSGFDERDASPESFARKMGWIKTAAAGRDVPPTINFLIQTVKVTDDRMSVARRLAQRSLWDAEQLLESPLVLIGTADEIADGIEQRRDRYGVTYFTVFERAIADMGQVIARRFS